MSLFPFFVHVPLPKFVLIQPNMDWAMQRLTEEPTVDLEFEPRIAKVVEEPNWETGLVKVTWYQAATMGNIK